jgi:hypothetical protein
METWPLPPPGKEDVTATFALSNQTSTLPLYRGLPPDEADEAYALSIAKQLAIDGEVTFEFNNYVVRSGIGEVKVIAVDQFAFYPTADYPMSRGSTAPDENELRRRARAFLSDHNLMPADAEITEVHNELKWPTVKLENKYLVPSDATTPEINMQFAEDGSLKWLGYVWPPIEKVGDYPIISEAQAFERILEPGAAYVALNKPSVAMVSVQMTLHDVVGKGALYFEPFYEFRSAGQDLALVSALPDEYLEHH